MFHARISLSFTRLFRLRKRRAAKESPASPTIAPAPDFGEPPLPPHKPYRPVSQQPETTPSRRPRSVFPAPLLTPIAQSPIPSPDVTPVSGTPPPTILIGQDTSRSILSLPPPPAPSGYLGPRLPVDGVSLLGAAPPASTARCVSFQLPTTRVAPHDRPATPLSTSSTLVSDGRAEAEAAAQTSRTVPSDLVIKPPAYKMPGSGIVGAESIPEPPSPGRPGPRKARPKSLFTPQPVRADVSRLSLPASKRNSRRESNRTSVSPPLSPARAVRREKRESKWSREMNKPETQEVLKAFSGF